MDGVHNRLHIYPLCGIFYFPWHRHQIEAKKGPTAFSVSSERHWQSGVKEIAKVSKRSLWDSIARPLDCQSHALSTEPPRPSLSSYTTTFRVTDSGFCSYTNPSRATIPLIRPHQCDSEGGRIRGVLLYCRYFWSEIGK